MHIFTDTEKSYQYIMIYFLEKKVRNNWDIIISLCLIIYDAPSCMVEENFASHNHLRNLYIVYYYIA